MTRYDPQAIGPDYNNNPPPDDNTQVQANELEWQKHIDKIGDPNVTFAEAIDTAVQALDGLIFPSGLSSVSASQSIAVTQNGNLINATGTITLTMPAAGSAGADWVVAVKNIGTGAITIEGNGAETIDGGTVVLNDTNDSVMIASNGTNMQVVAEKVGGNLSDTIDNEITDVHGSILFRNDTEWVGLPPGTAGQFLQTQGADADPVYANTIVLETEKAATGAQVDFTGVMAGAKRITITFRGVSINANDDIDIVIGDSGGLELTGYISTSVQIRTFGNDYGNSTTSFLLRSGVAANTVSGRVTLLRANDSHAWVCEGSVKNEIAIVTMVQGDKALSGELTQVSFATSGAGVFDAGFINIQIEK